jgi:hypothetical protein
LFEEIYMYRPNKKAKVFGTQRNTAVFFGGMNMRTGEICPHDQLEDTGGGIFDDDGTVTSLFVCCCCGTEIEIPERG